MVQNILNNLRTDLLTLDGVSYTNTLTKAFKDLRFVGDLKEEDFDSFYVGVGREDISYTGERNIYKCTLQVFGLIYFDISVDTRNQGTLETKAETLREDLHLLNETWSNTIATVDADSKKCVESVELISITPYINTGYPKRGELDFELRIIYYRG